METKIAPTQALQNLAVIASDYPLKGPDRKVIDASIAVLAKLIEDAKPQSETVG